MKQMCKTSYDPLTFVNISEYMSVYYILYFHVFETFCNNNEHDKGNLQFQMRIG